MDAFEYLRRESERLQSMLRPHLGTAAHMQREVERLQSMLRPHLGTAAHMQREVERLQSMLRPQLSLVEQAAQKLEQFQREAGPRPSFAEQAVQKLEQLRTALGPQLSLVEQAAQKFEQLHAMREPKLSLAEHDWLQRQAKLAEQSLNRYPELEDRLGAIRQQYPESVVTAIATVALPGIEATRTIDPETLQQEFSPDGLTEEDIDTANSILCRIEGCPLSEQITELAQAIKETNQSINRNTKAILQSRFHEQLVILLAIMQLLVAILNFRDDATSPPPQTSITQYQFPDIAINPTVVIAKDPVSCPTDDQAIVAPPESSGSSDDHDGTEGNASTPLNQSTKDKEDLLPEGD